jgi:type VI secretion system ImpC/EvpB family protein
MPGGEPYGLLLADFNVAHRPEQDVDALKDLSRVAAAAFAPIVLNADPRVFDLERFSDLGGMPTRTGIGALARIFDQPQHIRWREFRESDDARFLGLVLPKVLMRLPFDFDGSRADQFPYQESVGGPDSRGYLWGGAVYALGAVVIRAFDESNWLANIQGVERGRATGGLVTGLPVHCFGTDRDGMVQKCSTDVLITDRQEQILSELGFIPLCHCRDTEWSAFYRTPSIQTPKEYDRALASTNARMSASLQYMLSVSRFAHYLKVIGRDKIGTLATPDECQRFLQRWLLEYTVESDDESQETKARSPLREARVEVRERPGQPGSYFCVMHLRPHYQVDQVVTAVTLVTELAAASSGRA